MWFEPLQWTLRKCMDLNVSIDLHLKRKQEPTRQRHFSWVYIKQQPQWSDDFPHPRRVKLNHKPTATASQTIRLPPHHFTSPNHMACKLRIHNAGGRARRWRRPWRELTSCSYGKSCAVVPVTHFLPLGSISYFTWSRCGGCNEK